jgi:hypothetical protein
MDCGKIIEVELPVDELVHLGGKNSECKKVEVTIEDKQYSFRKPTGVDQYEWLKNSYSDLIGAKKTIYGTLAANPTEDIALSPIFEKKISLIERAFEEADPLVGYCLVVCCPYCEKNHPYEIDLQKLILYEIQKAQARLLNDIHQLALHYHWNENQILSLPPWRRAQYIAFLE